MIMHGRGVFGNKDGKGFALEHSYRRFVLLDPKMGLHWFHGTLGKRQHGIPKACMALLGVWVFWGVFWVWDSSPG
jgi:hypothetical protein